MQMLIPEYISRKKQPDIALGTINRWFMINKIPRAP